MARITIPNFVLSSDLPLVAKTFEISGSVTVPNGAAVGSVYYVDLDYSGDYMFLSAAIHSSHFDRTYTGGESLLIYSGMLSYPYCYYFASVRPISSTKLRCQVEVMDDGASTSMTWSDTITFNVAGILVL